MRIRVSLLGLFLLAGSAFATTGCIRSRLIVTSEPSGATVYFQGQERGDTPISIPFIWYWYYEVRVEEKGYKPVREIERLSAPPWLIMPLDLIAELIPVPIIDNHRRHYVLEPLTERPPGAAEPVPAP